MSRTSKTMLVLSGIFLLIWVVIVTTHVLDWYSIPTPSNSPVLEVGQNIWSSNLVDPERYDHVVFERDGEVYCHQLVGLEGDKIEFIDGRLYVNNKDMDDSIPTKRQFMVSFMDCENLVMTGYVERENTYQVTSGMSVIYMQEDTLNKLRVRSKKILRPKGEPDTVLIKTWRNTPWNADYFGPVKVPAGKIFVAGNNRQNALDSRYVGFIDVKKLLGVVIWK